MTKVLMARLDRLLANLGYGSRRDVQALVSTGKVTLDGVAIKDAGRKIAVTSRLVGNFPGSPVDLRFLFKLEGNKIESLEIIP